MSAVLLEQKMYKNTFIQQAIIEKLAFFETFRRMMMQSLYGQGQNRDADYYDLLRAFEELDRIKWTYQDAMSKIVRIFLDRM